jgi:hypothetical protein
LVECGASPSFIANKLLRRDSLAKYRIIPKVLDSLELHKDGEIATIYALEEWFKTTGMILYFAKLSLLKSLFAINDGLAPHSTKKLTFLKVSSSHLPKENAKVSSYIPQ